MNLRHCNIIGKHFNKWRSKKRFRINPKLKNLLSTNIINQEDILKYIEGELLDGKQIPLKMIAIYFSRNKS